MRQLTGLGLSSAFDQKESKGDTFGISGGRTAVSRRDN